MKLTILFAFSALAVGAAPMKDFSLPAVQGGTLSLKSQVTGKKAVAVIFVSVECPVSNAYNDRMAALHKELTAKNIALIGINSNKNESAASAKEHAAKVGLGFPILKDEGHKIADLFSATRTPEVFLLDPSLEVQYHGRIDDDSEGTNPKRSQDLLVAATELAAGKKVTTKETKFFGCSIKR